MAAQTATMQPDFARQDFALRAVPAVPAARAHPAARPQGLPATETPKQLLPRNVDGANCFSCVAPKTSCPDDAPRRIRDVPEHTPSKAPFSSPLAMPERRGMYD